MSCNKKKVWVQEKKLMFEIENEGISVRLLGEVNPVLSFYDKKASTEWAGRPLYFQCSILVPGEKYYTEKLEIVDRKISRRATSIRCVLVFKVLFDSESAPDVKVRCGWVIPKNGEWLEENIEILNENENALHLSSFQFQWQKSLTEPMSFLPVPFGLCSEKPGINSFNRNEEKSGLYEGLILMNYPSGLAIAKEPSDEEPQWIGTESDGRGNLRYAGVSSGVPSDMDFIIIKPDETYSFRSTRYFIFHGEVEKGLVLYRNYMAQHGVFLPEGYNPPLNYNIYYEFPGSSYYQKKELYDSIQMAMELGCDLLYTDQGWETYFGSGVWDKTRLGRLEDFVEYARSNGLKVGVLVPMHTKAFTFPMDAVRKDVNGIILNGDPWHTIGICPSSAAWQKKKLKNLKAIAKAGVSFFSFDFNNCDTKCYDNKHLHSVPIREWEHVKAVAAHQEKVKKSCPDVLIEAHDWSDAGIYRYPVYMFNASHHERWGFEYMWSPFEDFKSGRLHNLYYYNMAYEKPLYLHINLSDDNENAVVFWYIASTVRHLGVGDYKKLSLEKKELFRNVMAVYRKYRKHFVNGIFSGKGPLVHFHTLIGEGTIAVLFNDSDHKNSIEVSMKLEDSGVDSDSVAVDTLFGAKANWTADNGSVIIQQALAGYDVSVLLIHSVFPHKRLNDCKHIQIHNLS